MVKSSDYTRELTAKEIKLLQGKYNNHLNRTRKGFLERPMVERLLHITNWKRDTTDQDIYQYFYEIREHVKTALVDLQLICETLHEDQLQEIFGKNDATSITYPITNVLKSLIPYPLLFGSKAKEVMKKIEEKQQWRKYILEDVTIESLLWYFHSGIFKTELERNLIFDTIDAIQVRGTGKRQYSKIIERDGIAGIAKF